MTVSDSPQIKDWDGVVELLGRAIFLASFHPDDHAMAAEKFWGVNYFPEDEARARKAVEIALSALASAGVRLVPAEPTEEMEEAGRAEMPAEVDYWLENGVLHAEPRPLHKCVPPSNVFSAMCAASPFNKGAKP